jgi:hypothetical protein
MLRSYFRRVFRLPGPWSRHLKLWTRSILRRLYMTSARVDLRVLLASSGNNPELLGRVDLTYDEFIVLFSRTVLDIWRLHPRGVIHVGAYKGEGILMFLLLGFEKMILIDPQPKVFEELESHAAAMALLLDRLRASLGSVPTPRMHLEQCAAGDRDGTALLYRTSNQQMSSLKTPTLKVSSCVPVTMKTVDTILRGLPHGWVANDFNFLVIGPPEGTLMVLKGATNHLSQLDVIWIIWIDRYDIYEDCPTSGQVDGFLRSHGFAAAWRNRDAGVLYLSERVRARRPNHPR